MWAEMGTITAFLESCMANLLKFGVVSDLPIPLLGTSPIERTLEGKDICTRCLSQNCMLRQKKTLIRKWCIKCSVTTL